MPKPLNLTELQRHLAAESLRHSTSLLNQIRRQHLNSKQVEQMKILEGAVQNLEIFQLSTFPR